MNYKTPVADRIISFFRSLQLSIHLPKGIQVLNPYQDQSVMLCCEQFYKKYYNDTATRRIILGINPGRFGGGLTGIPFTDPIHLERYCGIENPLPKKAELSSKYIYEMIMAFGGPEMFYKKFYFSSISPLGFTKGEKNLNYYDDPRLQKKLKPFILSGIRAQLDFEIDRSVAYCLGEGTNYKFLKSLNEQHRFFQEVIPLAHPRFILQYKSKIKSVYIQRYLDAFRFTPGKAAS